jgi:hypothetical protein
MVKNTPQQNADAIREDRSASGQNAEDDEDRKAWEYEDENEENASKIK